MKKNTLTLIFIFFLLNVNAATFFWTGNIDTNWSKAGNWTDPFGSGVPGANDFVVIPSAASTNNVIPILEDGDIVVIEGLLLENGGNLVIREGARLTIRRDDFPTPAVGSGIQDNVCIELAGANSMLDNFGTLVINAVAMRDGSELIGILNRGRIRNSLSGFSILSRITINNDVDFGIIASSGTFFNSSIVTINNADGSVNSAGAAVRLDNGTFENTREDAELNINNCTQDGILLNGTGDLINGGKISMTGVDGPSLRVSGSGEFTNEVEGIFSADSDGFSSVRLDGGTMTNFGLMELKSANFYNIDILNNGILNNEMGASIEINLVDNARETTTGILSDDGSIFNKGEIVIDNVSWNYLNLIGNSTFENTDGAILYGIDDSMTRDGIEMENNAQFINGDACSGVILNANIGLQNAATFRNRENALVQLTTTESSEFTRNNGVIVRYSSGAVNVGNSGSSGTIISSNANTYIWTGFESNDWNTPCNWIRQNQYEEESIPINDLLGRIQINTQTGNNPITPKNLEVAVGKIDLLANTSLTIQDSSTLTIDGANFSGVCLTLPDKAQVNNNGELSLFRGSSGIFLTNQCSFTNNGRIEMRDIASINIPMLDDCIFNNNDTIDMIGGNTGITISESTFNNNTTGSILINDVSTGIALSDQFRTETDSFNNDGNITISDATEGIGNRGTFINSATGTINISDVSRAINTNGLFDNSNQVIADQDIRSKGVIIGWSATGIIGEFVNRTGAELNTTSIEFNGGATNLVNLGGIVNATDSIFSTQINDNNAAPSLLFGDGTYNIGGNLSLINARIRDDVNFPEVNTFNFNGGKSKITLEDGLSYEIGNVQINSSDTVTINEDFSVERELLVNTGTFILGPELALIADIDTLRIATNGTLNASDATINLTSDWENSGMFNAGTSTVNIIGDQDMEILGTATTAFDSLYIEKNTGIKATINADFSTQKRLIVQNGDVSIPSSTEISPQSISTVAGSLTNDGRINGARIQLNSTSSGDGIYNCTGVFITGSFFEEGTSTVIMSGAEEGAMLVTAPSNLYDLVIDKATPSTKVTFTDDFINLNDLSIKNGIFENDDFMRPKNIFIEAGGTLNLSSALFISGDVENNGQINPIGNARLLFNGDTTSEIRGSNPFTLDILEIDKSDPNAELQVSTDVTVNTKVEFDGANQGNINIESGTIITLASGAFIENETEGGYIFGDGSIETTVDLNAPSAANPGNLGVEVTSAASLGSTNIERFHQPQMSNGIESIARFYIITPTTNTGLDATVRFYYLDEELGFANESDLNAYRLLINNVWDVYPAIAKNTDLNFVEIANLDAFSTWTLFPSDLMVLPVNLLYFDAKEAKGAVILKWETASELDNAGFEVARSMNTKDWKTLGFVKGAGTTVTAQSYQYIDDAPAKGINYYRLKQIDTDGTYEYSEIIAVNKTGIGKDALVIAPNPVDDVLHYQLLGQKQATQSLQIYDASGQLVKIITDQDTSLPIHDLAKGMYILVVEIGNERLGAAFMKQ